MLLAEFGTVEYISLFFSTFLSEDLTCITAGILASSFQLDLFLSIIACTMGIYIGDFLLYCFGRCFGGLLVRSSIYVRIIRLKESSFGKLLQTHIGKSLFFSRFLPGTRLPLYLYCGVSKFPLGTFLSYTGFAVLLWAPSLVFASYLYGDSMKVLYLKDKYYIPVSIVLLWFFVVFLQTIINSEKRNKLVKVFLKWNRHEFWPSWLFYIPLGFYVFFLILKYRGFLWITAANPKIYAGGIAGESKYEILSNSYDPSILKTFLFTPNFFSKFPKAKLKLETFRAEIEKLGFSLPFILKPDIGERGIGVRLIKDWESAFQFLSECKEPYLIQKYHPGPLEAGVFYIRIPGKESGFVFSITKKFFPLLEGNGISTLEELISRHPRFRFQEPVFLERWKDQLELILQKGQIFSLGFGGNHIQGCEFRDGAESITPQLTLTIDSIAKSFPDFYFGRFDIRYEKESDLTEGTNLKVLELNGAMSESTNLYDPTFGLWKSYSILFRQWSYLFQVGFANAKLGTKTISWFELIRLLRNHSKYKESISPISK